MSGSDGWHEDFELEDRRSSDEHREAEADYRRAEAMTTQPTLAEDVDAVVNWMTKNVNEIVTLTGKPKADVYDIIDSITALTEDITISDGESLEAGDMARIMETYGRSSLCNNPEQGRIVAAEE